MRKTSFERHGAYHNMQDKDLFEKNQKAQFKTRPFKNTDLWYQGTYELDFLEKYYDKFPNIQRGFTIKYFFEGEQHSYFPDFYISSLNLIVEVKALYFYNKFEKQCEAKKKATITNGFKYLMILNKDYKELNLLAKSS